MSATVAAALKKIAVAILTDKKVLKTVCGIMLGIIIIIVMPIAVVLGIFSGNIEIDTDALKMQIEAQMSIEQQEMFKQMEQTMNSIERTMEKEGFSSRVKEAQILYVLALSDRAGEKAFVKKLVQCFKKNQTDEQLITAINTTFGISISTQEFVNVMQSVRAVYIDTSDYTDISTKNNLDLVKWAVHAEKSGWGYVWGTSGHVLSKESYKSLKELYPEEVGDYADFIEKNWIGKRTTDCSGLIRGYWWLNAKSNQVEIGSNNIPSMTSDEMFNNADRKGEISTISETPGLGVWQSGHIGIYIGNGEVIEAMGTEYGVVRTKLSEGHWTHWLRIPHIKYVKEKEKKKK